MVIRFVWRVLDDEIPIKLELIYLNSNYTMKNTLFLIIFIISLFSCQHRKEERSRITNSVFQTDDPSRIYFNNIRSINYYRTRKPNTDIDIYQLKKTVRTDERPIVRALILDNWMDKEAYVFVEKNEYPSFHEPLTVIIQGDNTVDTLQLAVFNKKNQYQFTEQVYHALTNRHPVAVKTKGGSFVPIYETYQDRNNFLTTLKDYYVLIDKERKDKRAKESANN